MREINLIVIHCADTYRTMDIGAEEIRKWHVDDNGWSDIGYHYVIRRNGDVEKGRELDVVGSHVKGYNANSIGICLVGGKPMKDEEPIGTHLFEDKQLESLKLLVKTLQMNYPNTEIKGHCDLDSKKTCPNFDVKTFFGV